MVGKLGGGTNEEDTRMGAWLLKNEEGYIRKVLPMPSGFSLPLNFTDLYPLFRAQILAPAHGDLPPSRTSANSSGSVAPAMHRRYDASILAATDSNNSMTRQSGMLSPHLAALEALSDPEIDGWCHAGCKRLFSPKKHLVDWHDSLQHSRGNGWTMACQLEKRRSPCSPSQSLGSEQQLDCVFLNFISSVLASCKAAIPLPVQGTQNLTRRGVMGSV